MIIFTLLFSKIRDWQLKYELSLRLIFFKCTIFLHKYIISPKNRPNSQFFVTKCWFFGSNCVEFLVKIWILGKLSFLTLGVRDKSCHYKKIPQCYNPHPHFRLKFFNMFSLISKIAWKAFKKSEILKIRQQLSCLDSS